MLTQPERDDLLLRWKAAKEELDRAKELEMDLRRQIEAELFTDAKEGVNTLELGNGWKVKFTPSTTYKLDPDKERVAAIKTAIANVGNEGSFIAERLLKWKPDLSVSEYKKLPDSEQGREIKALIDSVLTTQPGAPKLELVEPKS